MHNWNHILRIKKAIKILKEPYKELDESLLKFLINFHGLKDYVKKNKEEFNKEYVKLLLRHNRKPVKIEEKLVFDANMLDNMGKQGIKKALAYGKAIGRSEEDSYKYLKKSLRKVKLYTKKGKEIQKNHLINFINKTNLSII